MDFNPIKNSIIYAYRGSVAHNLFVPSDDENSTDDIDLMGVCVAPLRYYLGLQSFEQYTQLPTEDSADDIVVYDVRKFVKLLLKCNPNVLSILWNKPEMYLTVTESGKLLIDNRDIFISRDYVFKSFSGYAISQLKQMQRKQCKGYMGAKRKALVEKYGYDCKNSSHLVRLSRMGREFLQTGQLNVWRDKDREELLDIKNGKYSFDKIKEVAMHELSELEKVKDCKVLQEKPDAKKAEEILIEIIRKETE